MVDLGAPGRGRKVIEIKREGVLTRWGYHVDAPEKKRRAVLRWADKKFGSLTVWRMLNAQLVFRRREKKGENYKQFKADRDWVMKTLMSEPERRAMTRAARETWSEMTPKERADAMPGGKKRGKVRF